MKTPPVPLLISLLRPPPPPPSVLTPNSKHYPPFNSLGGGGGGVDIVECHLVSIVHGVPGTLPKHALSLLVEMGHGGHGLRR